jgi:hypothetical protein
MHQLAHGRRSHLQRTARYLSLTWNLWFGPDTCVCMQCPQHIEQPAASHSHVMRLHVHSAAACAQPHRKVQSLLLQRQDLVHPVAACIGAIEG